MVEKAFKNSKMMKSKSINYLRSFMNASGYLRPETSTGPSFFHKIRHFYFRIGLINFWAGSLAYVFFTEGSFIDKGDALFTSFVAIHILYKQIFATRAYKIETALISLEKLYYNLPVDILENDVLVEELEQKTYKFAHFFGVSYMVYLPAYLAKSTLSYILTGTFALPFKLLTPPGLNTFGKVMFQMSAALPAVFVQITFILSVIVFSKHLAYYIRILENMISKRPAQATDEYDQQCIQIHTEILSLSTTINKSLGDLIMADSALNPLECCLAAFIVINNFQELAAVIPSISNLFVALTIAYILNSCGQEVIDQGELLHRKVYEGLWYENKAEQMKNVYFIMLMSTKPIRLHFKGMATFNMHRFGNVLQGAYSYLTVLNSMIK